MSPFARPKYHSTDSGDNKAIRIRLDILTILVVAQLVVSVFLLCDRAPDKQDAKEPEQIAKVTKPVPEEEKAPEKAVVKTKPEKKPEEKKQAEVVAESPEPEKGINWTKIKIDVLNGCGKNGIARRTSDWMRKRGYTIREATNADRHDYRRSFIQLRRGDFAIAEKLADELGINRLRIYDIRSDDEEKVNLTLVVGLDYSELAFGR